MINLQITVAYIHLTNKIMIMNIECNNKFLNKLSFNI